MKATRALRTLTSITSAPSPSSLTGSALLRRFYSAQPQHDDPSPPNSEEYHSPEDAVFDSSHFGDLNLNSDGGNNRDAINQKPTWEEKYRDRVKTTVFGEDISRFKILKREEEKKAKAATLAKPLLESPLDEDEKEDAEEGEVTEENQKSLSVGIIGAPNAGKSALTNYMCFFDTPGLMLKKSGFPYNDIKVRSESAWSSVNLYDVLIVIFDVHRHLTRPDSRVVRLIERMGSKSNTNQSRVLCMNKVDLVTKKNDLLKVVEEFKDLLGYEKYFMISGLNGAGVKDLTQYLVEQAVRRPWDEDPFSMSEEVMKNISLEVVRERLLDYVHQEIPYGIEHRLIGWKQLRDGSLRIEQHFITHKISQRKILVGKKGSKIGRIGVEANEELRSIFKRDVHLILVVRVK